MRHDCRFFASRAYGETETVRTCELGLAPEAPWRCPADCAAFEPRVVADVGWTRGSTDVAGAPPEPPGLDEHGDEIAALLGEVESIVDAEAAEARRDAEAAFAEEQRRERRRRLIRRRRDDEDDVDDL